MLPSDSAAKDAALFAALDHLESAHITYWLCNGTLLGLVRDGCLIPWDNDIDIAISGETEKAAVAAAFAGSEFKLIDNGGATDYMTFDWRGTRVDINFFHPRGDEIVSVWRVPRSSGGGAMVKRLLRTLRIRPESVARLLPDSPRFWTREGYAAKASDVFPLRSLFALGRTIPVPGDAEATLEYTYGPEWRTPRPDFDWRRDGANNVREERPNA